MTHPIPETRGGGGGTLIASLDESEVDTGTRAFNVNPSSLRVARLYFVRDEGEGSQKRFRLERNHDVLFEIELPSTKELLEILRPISGSKGRWRLDASRLASLSLVATAHRRAEFLFDSEATASSRERTLLLSPVFRLALIRDLVRDTEPSRELHDLLHEEWCAVHSRLTPAGKGV